MLGTEHTSSPGRPHPVASSDLRGRSPPNAELAPQPASTATTGPRFPWGGVEEGGRRTEPSGGSNGPDSVPESFLRRLEPPGPGRWPSLPAAQGHGGSYNLSPSAAGRRGAERRDCPQPTWLAGLVWLSGCGAGHPSSAGAGRRVEAAGPPRVAKACADLHEKGRVACSAGGPGADDGPHPPRRAPPPPRAAAAAPRARGSSARAVPRSSP